MTHALVLLFLAAESTTPGIGVMDFATAGASPELAVAASSMATHELERLGTFRVFSSETLRVVLGVDRQRQLLGCENCSGSTLTDVTSFEYVVTGKVTRTGSGKDAQYTLLMTLLGVGSPQPLSSVQAKAGSEGALITEVGPSVVKLMSKLLAGRQGRVVVASSEVGAAVKIDDTQVGTTPLDGPQPVNAGPHLIAVEKDGFSAVRKEVRVTPEGVTEETFRLVPSPDTIAEYDSKATRTRVLAWVSVGLAAGGVGLFTAGQLRSNQLYGSPTVPGTFEFHRAALLQGLEVEGDVNHRIEANRIKTDIELWQTLGFVGVGVAGAGAVAATVLFIVGDPPGKYDAYRQRTTVSVHVVPTLGGGAVVGTF